MLHDHMQSWELMTYQDGYVSQQGPYLANKLIFIMVTYYVKPGNKNQTLFPYPYIEKMAAILSK